MDLDAADALATTVFVMGEERVGMIDGVEALVITNEREIRRTSGFGGHEVAEE